MCIHVHLVQGEDAVSVLLFCCSTFSTIFNFKDQLKSLMARKRHCKNTTVDCWPLLDRLKLLTTHRQVKLLTTLRQVKLLTTLSVHIRSTLYVFRYYRTLKGSLKLEDNMGTHCTFNCRLCPNTLNDTYFSNVGNVDFLGVWFIKIPYVASLCLELPYFFWSLYKNMVQM